MTENQPLDDTDRRILTELQKDGRIRNNDLAARVGLSPPACRRRVRALRERGVVKTIRASLDEQLLGYEVTSFVSIQLQSQARATVGVRKLDRGDTSRPAVLAAFGRIRFFAEMCRAQRRGNAPTAAAVCSDARCPQHPEPAGARRREG